jgi:Family of unknown function (DUF6220)
VRLWAIVFAAAAWLFLAGVILQVFLAGLGAFKLAPWAAHGQLGWVLGIAPIVILLFAIAANAERRTVWLAVALALATAIQPELATARHTDPVLAALHPVNALLVFWLAWLVARRSLLHLRDIAGRRVEHWVVDGQVVDGQVVEPSAATLPESPVAGDSA